MAVEDHPVHPSVVYKAGTPYGCHNKVPAEGYWTWERHYVEGGRYMMVEVFIKNAMSTECRYDKSLTDERCKTCKHKGSGERYAEQVVARSK